MELSPLPLILCEYHFSLIMLTVIMNQCLVLNLTDFTLFFLLFMLLDNCGRVSNPSVAHDICVCESEII